MRALVLLVLSLTPALAHASVDFKCESVKTADQIGGWLHFGFAGHGGAIQVEYWNGYPPLTLVEGDLDNGAALPEGLTRFTSEADRSSGNVALVDLPAGFSGEDKFPARLELRGKGRPVVYALTCVRH